MKKTIFTFGLISGLIMSVFMLLNMVIWGDEMNFELAEIFGYVSMIAALSTVFIGIRSYRDQKAGGTISFGKAFQIGLGITLVASALYVASWMIYSTVAAPDFMDQYYAHSVEQLKNSGASADEINEKIAEMEQFKELYKNPFVQMGVTFLEIFPVGLLVSLISAFFLKRGEQPASQGTSKLSAI